jgi:hypothetical protein
MSGQPDFSTAPRRPPALRWDRVAVAAALAVLVLAAVSALRARSEARAARTRVAEVRRDVAAAAARVRALEGRARGEAGRLSPADAPPVAVVAAVASALPASARLTRLTLDYRGGGALELHVVARDASSWDLLLERLAAAPRFAEVQPGPEAREAEVRSVVRARWAGGAP